VPALRSGGLSFLVAGRTPARIEQGVRGEAAGGIAEAVQTDATREEDVRRSFDRGMAPGPGIAPVDLIVSNAGNNRRLDFRRETCRLSAAAPLAEREGR
jgi:hypothetical protein